MLCRGCLDPRAMCCGPCCLCGHCLATWLSGVVPTKPAALWLWRGVVAPPEQEMAAGQTCALPLVCSQHIAADHLAVQGSFQWSIRRKN